MNTRTVSMVVLLAGCGGQEMFGNELEVKQAALSERQTFGLWNINLKKKGPVSDFERRLGNIADLVKQVDSEKGQDWSLIGLNEAWYDTEYEALGWGKYHQERPVPCTPNGALLFTPACMDRHLEGLAAVDYSAQAGDAAILARNSLFEPADNVVRSRKIGTQIVNTTRYRITGRRLRIKGTNYVQPFYSTHIAIFDTGEHVQGPMVDDLLEAVKEWWQPGDLAPIIVGDLNFDKESRPALFQQFAKDFIEVGDRFGKPGIEHVWIGKEASFSQTAGRLDYLDYHRVRAFHDGAVNLSDHGAPWVKLQLPDASEYTPAYVGARVADYNWSAGWTSVETFTVGVARYLFLLKEGDGSVHIHALSANGTVGTRVGTYDWSAGWTQARFFHTSQGTFLFLLKESDGSVHIHQMNQNGTVGPRTGTYNWSSGWTSAETYRMGGATYLFLLKASDGTVHAHRLNDNGTVGARTGTYDWSSGWTQVRFYSVAGATYLFLLKEGDGTVHIHQMNSGGDVGPFIEQYDWSEGWTQARFFYLGGLNNNAALGITYNKPYLMLMKEDGGAVHIHSINSDGTIGPESSRYNWTDGWTSATFFDGRDVHGGASYLFMLKEGDGIAHAHKMRL